jgi:hypothetical protein
MRCSNVMLRAARFGLPRHPDATGRLRRVLHHEIYAGFLFTEIQGIYSPSSFSPRTNAIHALWCARRRVPVMSNFLYRSISSSAVPALVGPHDILGSIFRKLLCKFFTRSVEISLNLEWIFQYICGDISHFSVLDSSKPSKMALLSSGTMSVM